MKFAVRTVRTDHYAVVLGDSMFASLEKAILQTQRRKSKILLHLDPVVQQACLPLLKNKIPVFEDVPLLVTPNGEEHKTLASANLLWQKMHELGAGKDALLVNLGGGMISDLGGFAAAAFQRGMATWHVPTTLIGMIDAAIGGKTGVNLEGVKNQTGFFYNPVGVGIWPGFLETLPMAHLQSGLAEIAKSALIRDEYFWKRVARIPVEEWLQKPVTDPVWFDLIQKTIRVKLEIVRQDPFEHRKRKLLNFGHTIGHAIESWFLNQGVPVGHGAAVAAGMICESALSRMKSGLAPSAEAEIKEWIQQGFDHLTWNKEAEPVMLRLMHRDKKNFAGSFRFTLLREPGKGCVNQVCSEAEVLEVLRSYQKQ
jgi:3-dehydroquinate synthase